jgi:hypothetical protein
VLLEEYTNDDGMHIIACGPVVGQRHRDKPIYKSRY